MFTRLALFCFFGVGLLRGVTSAQALPAALDACGHVFNPETLGLRLDRAEQTPLDSATTGCQQLAPYAITDFNTYMGALYTVALENLNPVQPGDWQRTISINFLGFSTKTKRISDTQKKQLMDSGRRGAQTFLSKPASLK